MLLVTPVALVVRASDLLILTNAYGINAALIDAAITARQRGAFLIGFNSHAHANGSAATHPARHCLASPWRSRARP